MKIIQLESGYVLGFDTQEEAQAELDLLKEPSKGRTETFSERFEQVWEHLKLRGIDPGQPLPAPAEELPAAAADLSASTSHETIVPLKTVTVGSKITHVDPATPEPESTTDYSNFPESGDPVTPAHKEVT